MFVLDELSTRNYTERTLLGEEQRAWLVSGLVSSNATIKLVVGGLPMTNWSALTNLVKSTFAYGPMRRTYSHSTARCRQP